MMKQKSLTRDEAEQAVRRLIQNWARTNDFDPENGDSPSFRAFRDWAEKNGHGEYFKFRSVGGADRVAEWWFAQELKKTSR